MFCPALEGLPIGSWCRVVVSSVGFGSELSKHGVGVGYVFLNCYVPRQFSCDDSKRIVVWLHGGAVNLYASTDGDVEFLKFVEFKYDSFAPALLAG
ncbi:hypothetical protein [Pseudoalteromonas marina]|uniref:Carboxylesterase type B domain-containing protein n=1 Tax=Pseudoalteromonas marina TaxID=267375 RepID=A0ABT9FCG1_9GAMM|nr:hypothetical protein [Pseudoalteromonas marina]MDP2564477.1 hypothetical protein [Pseudoalteromonas marina]